VSMTPQAQPKFQLVNTPDYRESYAKSVQIRVNLWDFFLDVRNGESDRAGYVVFEFLRGKF